jgi:hypothetical protein
MQMISMVVQGECARDAVKREILVFAYDGKRHAKHEFVDELGKEKRDYRFAKGTVIKYLEELVTEDEMIDREPEPTKTGFRAVYSINQRGIEEVKRIRNRNLLDSLDAKWLDPLKNLLIRMKTEDPNRMLEGYCYTFIGDVPCAFTKSPHAFQQHMELEQSLRERHLKDLERFHEDFVSAKDKESRAKVDAKIKEEVGRTVGEYIRKLSRKTEQEDGFHRMLAILGITDEMLEEMQRSQQGY